MCSYDTWKTATPTYLDFDECMLCEECGQQNDTDGELCLDCIRMHEAMDYGADLYATELDAEMHRAIASAGVEAQGYRGGTI